MIETELIDIFVWGYEKPEKYIETGEAQSALFECKEKHGELWRGGRSVMQWVLSEHWQERPYEKQ